MTDSNSIIEVKNLNKSFGGIPAVINVNLQLKKGDIYGFVGPNGSGKTTTIRMLCGLLTPDSGEGHCLGYNILTQSLMIKQEVGYMTQRFTLYEDLTVAENIDFMARLYNIKDRIGAVNSVLTKLDLTSQKDKLAGTLSGGWKQHLALAICLLHHPKILLLDEPTSGVDPEARHEFWRLIHQFSDEGGTTLVSTHYMEEISHCNQLAYIAYGKILAQGKPKEIIQNSGLQTLAVTGEKLAEVADELKSFPQVGQVVQFSDVLHVSGYNQEALGSALNKFLISHEIQWELITPNIEDVFIALGKKGHEQQKK